MSAQYSLAGTPRAFCGPSRVWFGEGAAAQIGDWVEALGLRPGPALLVTDATVDRFGLARDVAAGLTGRGYEVHRFADIPGEPSAEIADRAAALARRAAPVVVVGVGGGSVMDVAKFAAALARNPGSAVDYTQFGGRRFAEAAVPAVLIPTTAGTGAEASQNAVVATEGRKAFANRHPQLLAAAAILDPLLTHSLPPAVTAQTGLDALSHCMESALSTEASALTDQMGAQGIRLIFGALRRACGDGDDRQARADMLLAAYFGGLALNAGVVLGHSIAYTLANRLHLPHGLSCALALPYTLAYNRQAAPERLRALGYAAGGEPVGAVTALCRDVGIPPSLEALGLERDELPRLVEECLGRYPRPNNPRPLNAGPLLSLYTAMWEGRPADAWAA